MAAFDIQQVLDLSLPRYRCENCGALWPAIPETKKEGGPVCPVCKVRYVPWADEDHWASDVGGYLRMKECSIDFPDVLGHIRVLAGIARKLSLQQQNKIHLTHPDARDKYTHLRALLQALASARCFVHFSTFGITPFMLGMLKVVAQRIPVLGVVAQAKGYGLRNVLDSIKHRDEALRLDLRLLVAEDHTVNLPHQKLVVIDGCLAFWGSANLNEQAWRKADEALEKIETLTDVQKVVDLNNRYFAPVWVRAGGAEAKQVREVEMTGHPFGLPYDEELDLPGP